MHFGGRCSHTCLSSSTYLLTTVPDLLAEAEHARRRLYFQLPLEPSADFDPVQPIQRSAPVRTRNAR